MKSKYLDFILDIVAEETEIDKHDILGKNKSIEMVDARTLFCYFANETVRSKQAIARYMNCCTERVGYLLSTFDERKKVHIFQIFYSKIKKKLLEFKEKEIQ